MSATLENMKSKSPSGFRKVLQEELIKRCRANPRYSLRAYARSLRIEPSALSQILNGKRPITEKMKLRLGSALGLSVRDLERLKVEPELVGKRQMHLQQIALDSFAVISDWYHYAILELTHVEGFVSDAGYVSRKLGITKSEANIAVERLFRMGLLESAEDGSWRDTSEDGNLTHISPAATSDAARKYQVQLLELSQQAVREIPITERNHTSATFSFDFEELSEAIAQIAGFRRKFAKRFEKRKRANSVYQLQISFFPLTKKNK